MSEQRIHRAVSADGTEIAGRVHGEGPPLVLVHGGAGDGEHSWEAMLPCLTDRFTCYTMSTRGRGLSAAPSDGDHSLERIVDDVVAFADSVGEAVALMGHSLGGTIALGAAAQSAAVRAVAVYEPAVFEVVSDVHPRAAQHTARFVELAAQGKLLYLHGARTPTRWHADGARHVVDHAADVRVVEVPDVAHLAPGLAPQPIADELVRFLTPA